MDYVDVPAPVSAFIVRAAFSGEFVDKVITAESSGDPRARPCDPETGKPLSSAYGAGQFVEATWLELVRRHRPDLAAKSDQEILDMRGDFALSREMAVRYTEQNRTHLIRNGLDPTHAALYLAHFAGATGATKLLKVHRDTPVETILSPEAIEANAFLKGQTPATLYAWAREKMNVEVSPAVRQAAVGSSDKVTPYAEVPGCGAGKASSEDTVAVPAPQGGPDIRPVKTGTPEPEGTRLSDAFTLSVSQGGGTRSTRRPGTEQSFA